MERQRLVTFFYCDCCGDCIGDEDNGIDGTEEDGKIYCWSCFEQMEREKQKEDED